LNQGEIGRARSLHEESLSLRREMGDKWGIAMSLSDLGNVAYRQGDYTAARAFFEESLSLHRETGDPWGMAISLGNLAAVTVIQGDYATAQKLYEESLSISREKGQKVFTAISLNNLGNVAYHQGDYITARALQHESLALCEEMDNKSHKAYALFDLGLIDLAEKKPEARERILDSLRLRLELKEPVMQISSLVGLAGWALQTGDTVGAAQWLGAISSALKALDAAIEGDAIQLHAQTLAAAKESLGEAAFQSAWNEGSKWRLEEAVNKALSA